MKEMIFTHQKILARTASFAESCMLRVHQLEVQVASCVCAQHPRNPAGHKPSPSECIACACRPRSRGGATDESHQSSHATRCLTPSFCCAAKMRHGQALTDRDRMPWLLSLQAAADSHARGCADGRAVIACSALKRAHRRVLRGTHPPNRVAIVRTATLRQCQSALSASLGGGQPDSCMTEVGPRTVCAACAAAWPPAAHHSSLLAGDAPADQGTGAGARAGQGAAGLPLHGTLAVGRPASHARATAYAPRLFLLPAWRAPLPRRPACRLSMSSSSGA